MQHRFAWRSTVLASLALGMSSASAFAQTEHGDAEVRHVAVSYGDLDLNTAHGRARLALRLQHAAATACGRDDGARMGASDFDAQRCYDKAMDNARTALARARAQADRQLVAR